MNSSKELPGHEVLPKQEEADGVLLSNLQPVVAAKLYYLLVGILATDHLAGCAFVRAAGKDAEVMVPASDAPEHPPSLRALREYFELQLAQACDWFRELYRPLEITRRTLQSKFEAIAPKCESAAQEMNGRGAEENGFSSMNFGIVQPTTLEWWTESKADSPGIHVGREGALSLRNIRTRSAPPLGRDEESFRQERMR